MSQKVKLLISALVVALLLTVGATAIVMAQNESAPPETNGHGIMARVAQILGIPQEELVGAIKQARQEMRQEALERALDKAVEKGLITEEESTEIREWLEQKPEALNNLRPHIMHALKERHRQRLLRAAN